jgi:hypothetical protein
MLSTKMFSTKLMRPLPCNDSLQTMRAAQNFSVIMINRDQFSTSYPLSETLTCDSVKSDVDKFIQNLQFYAVAMFVIIKT